MQLWIGLDVRSKDLSMFAKITQKGIATPSSHYLYCFYWNPFQEVKEGGAYFNAMSLQGFYVTIPHLILFLLFTHVRCLNAASLFPHFIHFRCLNAASLIVLEYSLTIFLYA